MTELTEAQLKELPWHPVESTNVGAVAWREKANEVGELFIEFKPKDEDGDSTFYAYENVSKDRYERLRDAQSVGSMFRKLILEKFAYERIDLVPEPFDDPDLVGTGTTELVDIREFKTLRDEVRALQHDMENVKKGLAALSNPKNRREVDRG